MAVALMEVLSSWSQMGVYSRITQPGDRMQRFFGCQIGGPRENRQRGRMFSFHYFDHTRDVAAFRAPNAGPRVIANQPVGQVAGTFARTYAKKRLEYEFLGNIRQLGEATTLDVGGQQYIARQQRHLYQTFSNNRELALVMALRGKMELKFTGEDWVPVFSGGSHTINFGVPDGNKAQVKDAANNDIIGASWASDTTKILDHLFKIEQRGEELTGRPFRHIFTDSVVWAYVVQNKQVAAVAGSVNTPFNSYDMIEEPGPDGKPVRYYTAVLKAAPQFTWHIYNGGLNVDGTYKRFFDGTNCTMCPDPDNDWIEMGVGSEYVVERPGADATDRVGFFPWAKTVDEPAGLELHGVDNMMPMLYVPKAVFHPTVVF